MKRHLKINNVTLRRARKGLDLTQEEAAKKLGITRKTYARYEAEQAYLSDEMVDRLVALVGVAPDKLVMFDINEKIEAVKTLPMAEFRAKIEAFKKTV